MKYFFHLLFCLMLLTPEKVFATIFFMSDALDEKTISINETTPDTAAPDLGATGQLMDNLTGSLRTRYLHYFDEPTCSGSTGRVKEGGTRDAEIFLEWFTRMNKDNWRLGLSGWFGAGTQGDLWGGNSDFVQDSDLRRPYVKVNELYLRYYADTFDVMAGKQVVRNGFGHIYSPADRFGPRDYTDPFDERSLGVWQLRMDYYFPSFSVSGAVLPIFQPSRFPGIDSRWGVNPTGIDLLCDPRLRLEGIRKLPGVEFNGISLMSLAKTNLPGWDLYALGYYGINPYPIARLVDIDFAPFSYPSSGPLVSARFESDYLKVLDFGAGFATTLGRLEIYGEGLYQISLEGEDDDGLNYLLGLSLRLGGSWTRSIAEEIRLNLEYSGLWVTRSRKSDGFSLPSRSFITGGKNLFLGRMDFRLDSRTELSLAAGATESPQDFLYRIEGRFRVQPQWLLRLTLEIFQTDTTGYLGPWLDNDRLIAAIEYRF